MPHVSRHKVDKEVFRSIHDRLIEVLAGFTERRDLSDLLDDLLTKTERTMIAKRLAIAVMLHKGYPFGVISRTLKVSEGTISIMRERIDRGGKGFEKALIRLEKEKKLAVLLANLDKVIRFFATPPIAGKENWRFFRLQ